MCGILGHVGFVEKDRIQQCLDTLVHRGPDGEGLWHTPEVTLGHRRLAILDLNERSKQPMFSPSERYSITFNGEIYNFIELKAELEKLGHRFRTTSDTEVVLAAFDEWGPHCLNRFNGMWALAIWDRKEKALFLARDRWGKKPLFYAQTQTGFAFASEMKALFPLLDEVKPNLPLVTASHRLFTYEASDECVIEGVSRFPAAHFGWYRDGKLTSHRWWCTLDHLPQVPKRFEDQVEQFREIFLDACKIRMRSDVPIGTALSGGLDSSSTIAAMAHLSAANGSDRSRVSQLHAFVSAFPGSPFDESEFAQQVIDHTGVKGAILPIDPVSALGDLERYYYLFEDLYISSPIPFMLTYRAIKQAGVSVTLDGHAGDELFLGYTSDILAALSYDCRNHPLLGLQAARSYLDSFPKDSPQFVQQGPAWKFLLKTRSQQKEKVRLGQQEVVRSRDENHPAWAGLSHVDRRLYVHTHETTLPTLLRNYDRLSMSNSVEIRMPFLDPRLATFAFALPWTSKLRGGYSKAIIRHAMAPYMPKSVAFRRTKIGWSSPILDWMKGPLKPFILDLIRTRAFRESNLIDSKQVSSQIEKLIADPNSKYDDAQNAWTLMTPFLWENAVIKNWRQYSQAGVESRHVLPNPLASAGAPPQAIQP